ncbi:hypothetical protein ESY86_19925 [Subsaximicrobium wynnwilliamsii]|uniref:Uncharacterized protein n=1 Tax=Subsaximicrobium wynnwilliamsii TaxID=291179 RepID=A0A5C6ZBY9_9FLAO|nr:hypothetical protein [Subsaximicrobium wynnwilliamsii]TXD80807.1 hypothetical protein ESY87_20095 [Subsaximicrobium wynnwilliamsii]TXD86549.1 hypothetical protein ESY86_19925 [Subsaximicrobium wynnwilliamsii]TXE00095.1 hypothetical protein ESY88_20035 [Subsaximicrobium wynnwilliamsii]
MKKTFLFLAILMISFSCEKGSLEEQTSSYDLNFNFESQNSKTDSKSKSQVEQFNATIITDGDDIDIISDSLEISRAVNSETGKESYVIHLKNNSEQNTTAKTGGPVRELFDNVESGYFYDGNDCWIYGTWYHGDNGESLFVPAGAATQYLNNVCGWSNVA